MKAFGAESAQNNQMINPLDADASASSFFDNLANSQQQ